MTPSLPLRIFLATPGDLGDERKLVLAAVEEHNNRGAGASNVAFEVVGWEQIRGTARRPQEAINELISESHFMIVMFKEKWGSEPGSPWGYTSGTEEELFTGLLELGQSEQPMRDVWVAFMAHATPEERVTRLKEQMVREHSMLFEATPDLRELKTKLADRLVSWEDMASTKRPRHIDLISSTGREVLKAAKLRIAGEKLVELGQPDVGRASLAEAAAIGGPVENLAYAQLLARQGELDAAFASTQKAIEQCLQGAADLYSNLTAEAVAAQAGVLRRQGQVGAAVGRLEHALTLLIEDDPFTNQIRSRILDDLGIAFRGLKRLEDSETAFLKSLKIREIASPVHEIAQSYVNLARVSVAAEDLASALTRAEEADRLLRNSAPTALHANAAVLLAQVHLRLGDPELGVSHAERALLLNQQFANTRGEAIGLLLLAQCFRAAGRPDQAIEYSQKCLEVNTKMGNQMGVERARWLLSELGAA